MSHSSSLSRLILTALVAFALPISAQAVEIPQRKPGLWRITTVSSMVGKRDLDACITDKDNIAVPEAAGDCETPEVLQAGSEVIVNVVCKKDGNKQTISTAFSGDFKTRYHAVVKMTFDPPMGGLRVYGMTIDAKYVGEKCPAQPAAKPAQ